MRNDFIALAAALSFAAVPAAAQTAAQQPQANAAPKMVKKKVCKRQAADIGSLVGGSKRVCRIVDVPADGRAEEASQQRPKPAQDAGAHN
jgi:hypothetical protein